MLIGPVPDLCILFTLLWCTSHVIMSGFVTSPNSYMHVNYLANTLGSVCYNLFFNSV